MEIDELDDDFELDDDKDYQTEVPYNVQYQQEEEDDEESEESEEDSSDENNNNSDELEDEEDLISSLLKSRGISDASKIKFENEDGSIDEVDWNSLSRSEQINILNSNESDNDLDDSEIDFLNRLRLSNISPAEYTEMIRQQTIAQYNQQLAQQQQQNYQPTYQIDDLSDDDLFVLDMQARIEGVTDDQLADALEKAKEDEDFYKKQIKGIRDEYKKLEDDKRERDAALLQQQQQEQFNQFADSVANAIQDFTNVGELDVDMNNDDMDELYEFITGTDQAGVNHFAKAVNDPETLVKMAWFALHGDDVLNSISNYYKQEIQRAHRAGYEQGKNQNKPKENKQNKVVVDKKTQKQVKQNVRKSVDDLDID